MATITTTTTRGSRVLVKSSARQEEEVKKVTEKHWRPFPWNHVPDYVSAILGFSVIIPIAPFMGVLIGSAELTWAACWRLHRALGLGFINRAVLSVAEFFGQYVLADKRDFSYLPYIFFLSTWTPILFCISLYYK
jgi:hypothetical protein